MNEQQLNEIEARLKAATSGPWVDTDSKPEAEGVVLILAGSDPLSTDAREICVFCDMEVCDGQDLHNSVFVAHAPDDMAALIAEVKRLQAENATVRNKWTAMQQFEDEEPGMGDPDNWRCWRKELAAKRNQFYDLITSLDADKTPWN
jgi:hypothetical protein